MDLLIILTLTAGRSSRRKYTWVKQGGRLQRYGKHIHNRSSVLLPAICERKLIYRIKLIAILRLECNYSNKRTNPFSMTTGKTDLYMKPRMQMWTCTCLVPGSTWIRSVISPYILYFIHFKLWYFSLFLAVSRWLFYNAYNFCDKSICLTFLCSSTFIRQL